MRVEHLGYMRDDLDELEVAIARAINEGKLLLAEKLRERWIRLWNASLDSNDG